MCTPIYCISSSLPLYPLACIPSRYRLLRPHASSATTSISATDSTASFANTAHAAVSTSGGGGSSSSSSACGNGGGGVSGGGVGARQALLPGVMLQMRKYNATRARSRVEHCLGGMVHRMNSGAAIAAAAGVGSEDESRKFILEEEGWQPLISLGYALMSLCLGEACGAMDSVRLTLVFLSCRWSEHAEDRHISMMSLANISQGRAQARRLVREGGMRVLLNCVSLALEAVEAARGRDDEGGRAGGSKVEEETLHYASMTLVNLASCKDSRDAVIRHGLHQHLVRIASHSPWKACRYTAARALARLSADERWQDVMLATRVVGPLVELALQAMFHAMQKDALDSIKALASNPSIRDALWAELCMCMRARGIALGGDKGQGKGAGGAMGEGGTSGGEAKREKPLMKDDDDDEEKENTPPQDRLLSLMRKLEHGVEEVLGEGTGRSENEEDNNVDGSGRKKHWGGGGLMREVSDAQSLGSAVGDSGDSLSPTSLRHLWGERAGGPMGGRPSRKDPESDKEERDRNVLGTDGFEMGIDGLEAIEGPEEVYVGSSGVVQVMRVREGGRGHGRAEGGTAKPQVTAGRRVAVKFVMIDLRPEERAALLWQVARNYTCGRQGELGVGASGGGRGERGAGGERRGTDGSGMNVVHPNIIGFFGAVYDPVGRRLGIVIDLVRGGNLQQMYLAVKRETGGGARGVNESALRCVVQQSLEGLEYMHRRHLIHRDIKPSSLLLRIDGQVLVTNLGNIRHLAKTAGHAASVVGTSCYFAPERIVGTCFQTSVDIWALGVTMLEAATSVYPFKGQQDNYMALLEHIVASIDSPVLLHIQRTGCQLSPGLQRFLELCLRNEASARPSAAQLLEDEFVTSVPVAESRAALVLLIRSIAFGNFPGP
jgi:serine/threonine protein kinase